MSPPEFHNQRDPEHLHSKTTSDSPHESLLDDFWGSIKEFSTKFEAQKADTRAAAETSGKFGDLIITGLDSIAAPVANGESNHESAGLRGRGAGADLTQPESLARRYETIARTEMEQVHAGLQYTTDGSTPQVIKFQEKFALTSTQTLDQIARSQLGPKATVEQIETYAKALAMVNIDETIINASGDSELPAGDIRLPGQTEQGSIVYTLPNNFHVTTWRDGSSLEQDEHGTYRAFFTKGTEEVEVSWHPYDLTQNSLQRTVNTSDPTTKVQRSVTTKQCTDSDGRHVETLIEDSVTRSVTVTDIYSNVYQFAPDKDGQFHGTKTNRGTVVDSDVWMTEDNRMYSKELGKNGQVTRKYEDESTETFNKRGRLLERTSKDDKGRSVEESYKRGKYHPHQLTLNDKDGNIIELQRGADGDLHGTKKDKSGAIIDADVGMTADEGYGIFSRKKQADGTSTKTFENGIVQKFDKHGQLIHMEGLDSGKRNFSVEFVAGESTPHTYKLEVTPGKPALEFKKTADGRFLADDLSSAGSKIGTIERIEGDVLVYRDIAGNEVRSLRADGISVTKTSISGGGESVTEEKDGRTRTVVTDANGRATSETWTADKLSVETVYRHAADGKVTTDKIIIRNQADHTVTSLTYDAKSDSYSGTRTGAHANETVVYDGQFLIYRDGNGNVLRAEKFVSDSAELKTSFVKVDYDPDSGVVSRTLASKAVAKESLDRGRVEIVGSNGQTSGSTLDGYTLVSGPDSATMVYRQDYQDGVMVEPNGKVTIWDKSGTRTEQLSSAEKMFLDAHPDLSRCDAAQLHRRLSPDQQKIDAFYNSLSRIEKEESLTPAEKDGLLQNLVRHVAFPAEIYQGGSPTCGVAVVQRDMAITAPGKYADFVIDAIASGSHTTSDGKEIRFNQDNLKMPDSSGRDLASRVFQTAALNVLLYPKGKAVLNTESGNVQIRSISYQGTVWPMDEYYFSYGPETDTFKGLSVPEVAGIMQKLTGEKRAGIKVDSAEELVALFKNNDSKPLTLFVNGSEYPFENSGPVAESDGVNHYVTIVGIDDGPPVKFLIQNQWGLTSDHSTALTAIDADDLMFNISEGGTDKGYAVGHVPNGRPNKFYELAVKPDGSIDLTL